MNSYLQALPRRLTVSSLLEIMLTLFHCFKLLQVGPTYDCSLRFATVPLLDADSRNGAELERRLSMTE